MQLNLSFYVENFIFLQWLIEFKFHSSAKLPKWFGERPGKKAGEPETPEGEEDAKVGEAEEEEVEEEEEKPVSFFSPQPTIHEGFDLTFFLSKQAAEPEEEEEEEEEVSLAIDQLDLSFLLTKLFYFITFAGRRRGRRRSELIIIP